MYPLSVRMLHAFLTGFFRRQGDDVRQCRRQDGTVVCWRRQPWRVHTSRELRAVSRDLSFYRTHFYGFT